MRVTFKYPDREALDPPAERRGHQAKEEDVRWGGSVAAKLVRRTGGVDGEAVGGAAASAPLPRPGGRICRPGSLLRRRRARRRPGCARTRDACLPLPLRRHRRTLAVVGPVRGLLLGCGGRRIFAPRDALSAVRTRPSIFTFAPPVTRVVVDSLNPRKCSCSPPCARSVLIPFNSAIIIRI